MKDASDAEEEKKGSPTEDTEKDSNKKKPMNEEVVKQIEKLYKYYEAQRDIGRMHGYRRALQALRSYD